MSTITAAYAQHEEEWAVTVTGFGHELHASAPGIIAARDRAEQLIERLTPEDTRPTVVHLLNGSALQFTSTYMGARLARNDLPSTDELDEEYDEGVPPENGQDPVSEPNTVPAESATAGEQGTARRSVTLSNAPSSSAPESEDETPDENPGNDPGEGQRGSGQEHGVPRKALHKAPEAAEATEHQQESNHPPDTAQGEAEFAGTTTAAEDHT